MVAVDILYILSSTIGSMVERERTIVVVWGVVTVVVVVVVSFVVDLYARTAPCLARLLNSNFYYLLRRKEDTYHNYSEQRH